MPGTMLTVGASALQHVALQLHSRMDDVLQQLLSKAHIELHSTSCLLAMSLVCTSYPPHRQPPHTTPPKCLHSMISVILPHRQQMLKVQVLKLTDAVMFPYLLEGKDKIRLYGIDAPEKTQECKDAKGQTYACGKASTDFLKQKVGSKALRCEVSMDLARGVTVVCLWRGCGALCRHCMPAGGATESPTHA